MRSSLRFIDISQYQKLFFLNYSQVIPEEETLTLLFHLELHFFHHFIPLFFMFYSLKKKKIVIIGSLPSLVF
jgi:hypothetical protein